VIRLGASATGVVLALALAGGGASMAQERSPEPGNSKRLATPLNTIAEVFRALEACWVPPDLDHARPGMQITVLLSFKRSGDLNGEPRITYETPGATDAQRYSYRLALAQAITRCTPLPFTEALGNALAGRPMTMRFVDRRNLKEAGTQNGRAS
jgi:hypothetical protein